MLKTLSARMSGLRVLRPVYRYQTISTVSARMSGLRALRLEIPRLAVVVSRRGCLAFGPCDLVLPSVEPVSSARLSGLRALRRSNIRTGMPRASARMSGLRALRPAASFDTATTYVRADVWPSGHLI